MGFVERLRHFKEPGMIRLLLLAGALLASLFHSIGSGVDASSSLARDRSRGDSGHEERAAPPGMASDFALRDQYNQLSNYRFPAERVTVLIFGDRKGSEQIEGWVRPLWDRYQARIDQRGVAVLSSVPAMVRGLVRTIFRSQVKYSVLLDWKGEVSQAYGYQNGRANLVLIDRQGRIVLRLHGAAEAASLGQLFTRIDQLLGEQ